MHPGSSLDFPVSGLVLEGAGWSEVTKKLTFSREIKQSLALCHIRWSRRHDSEDGSQGVEGASARISGPVVSLPVYLHGGRRELIMTVELPVPVEVPPLVWRQRGVALLAWGPVV